MRYTDPVGSYGNGSACAGCGNWIPAGSGHYCPQVSSWAPQTEPQITINQQARIASALERIAAALEKI